MTETSDGQVRRAATDPVDKVVAVHAIPPQLDLYQRGPQSGLARGPSAEAAA